MKREVKTIPTPIASQGKAAEAPANGTPSGIRYISSQKHQEIKRRLLTLHDGLLRKLAEHDRQR
jgi:hypothetical protein